MTRTHELASNYCWRQQGGNQSGQMNECIHLTTKRAPKIKRKKELLKCESSKYVINQWPRSLRRTKNNTCLSSCSPFVKTIIMLIFTVLLMFIFNDEKSIKQQVEGKFSETSLKLKRSILFKILHKIQHNSFVQPKRATENA